MKNDLSQQLIAIGVGVGVALLFGSWALRYNVPTSSSWGLAIVAFFSGTSGARLVQVGMLKSLRLQFVSALVLCSFLLPQTFSRDFMLDAHIGNFFQAYAALFGLVCYIAGAFDFSNARSAEKIEET